MFNPSVPWSELERRLSGRPKPSASSSNSPRKDGRDNPLPRGTDGGDSPAWSRKRGAYTAPEGLASYLNTSWESSAETYAELHCHSAFSFLDGASMPEELAEEAARLGLSALAITDHDGLYGIVRFAEAARAVGLPTIFGAEITLGSHRRQPNQPDPEGEHLVVLARSPKGYASLARLVSEAHLRGGEKGQPKVELSHMAQLHGGQWSVLTGCRKGFVPSALLRDGPTSASNRLGLLQEIFGKDRVAVELWDHGHPLDSHRNDALAEIAVRQGALLVATNNVHYATVSRRKLATAMAAVRARRSLDEIDGWLPASSAAHLRSAAEQLQRFARYPGVVEAASDLGGECAFDLALVAPKLPDFPVPEGHTEMTFLRRLTEIGAQRLYGPRDGERVAGAYAQIDHELDVIEALGFPGYFLVVWDIVEFCRRADIYCQGRGSAANSAVCYALGVTKADAVRLGLLFERFLSTERDGPPDIDIDIESDRREEVIQYVYGRYGRQHAAQVANVITYRARSAVREMGKALGYSQGQVDAFTKHLDSWGDVPTSQRESFESGIPMPVLRLASEIQDLPRHLGIHSGGMVICDRPVVEVCPVEWARMENRSVLQWDKDDCAAAGLVKFDLLGLGMLSAIHRAVDLVETHHRVKVDLATLPQDSAVYDQLCKGDSVGVFQVESRAQMATLPRLKPRNFYDLVVEVALIRPGPIQGGSVHPYLRRRAGVEPVTYLHPLLEHSLRKTLGVPLFQEQLMQMAIDVAGFSPAESDQLRQAMGSKRSHKRMEQLKRRLYDGMAVNGITGDIADAIYEKLAAFANFGFPESHSVSFAYLVYASAWLRHHYPAAFCAALLDAQPMGFWSPHTLVGDARRHGVVTHGVDVNFSGARPGIEPDDSSATGMAVRLGLNEVRSIGDDLAEEIEIQRVLLGPYVSMEDLVRRTGANLPALEALAAAGGFGSLGLTRREAMWAAGVVSQARVDRLPGMVVGSKAPRLRPMQRPEESASDLWSTGIAPDGHPTKYMRADLKALGVTVAAELASVLDGSRVRVAGIITHRQRPATAAGTTFMNLEDETGLINVVCSRGFWVRNRTVARTSSAVLIRGRVERVDTVVNVIAEKIEDLPLVFRIKSRDFR